jgi:hypothetical protein
MSQQQKPKSSIQPIQDVLDKGVELGGAWPLASPLVLAQGVDDSAQCPRMQ